jgi:hypothetical protein
VFVVRSTPNHIIFKYRSLDYCYVGFRHAYLTVEDSVPKRERLFSPQIPPHVTLTIVESNLDSMWELHSDTCKDEKGCLLQCFGVLMYLSQNYNARVSLPV